MNAWQLFKRFWVHVALLAGCAVFAFPFLWLVSTSAKRNEELGVFPPRWIPRLPASSDRGPFIDGGAYDTTEPPKQLSESDWARVRPRIDEALWAAACEKLGPARLDAGRAMADDTFFRPQMIRALWTQAAEVVPDDVWKKPDALPAFIGREVTAEMVERAWNNIVRRLAVGALKIRLRSNDLAQPLETTGWQTVGPARLAAGTDEGEPSEQIAYDFAEAATFSLVQTLRLPETAENVRALNIPIHSDSTWHRVEVTVESGGRVFRAERPLWMDIRSWQEVEYTFVPPAYRGTRSITLEPVEGAATDVTDPKAVRLTLTWNRSSPLRAALDKYIDSYRWALRYIPFDVQLRNTIILVVLNVLGQLFACSLAAYAFARLKFWGRDVLFGLLLATMMLPGQVTMIPQFILWKSLGWYNTLRPLWVPAWFGAAFFIFLLRQFFMTIPKEMEEAAKIDGCGFFGIYWRIMLPLAAPAIATVAIFSFMGAWNEFVSPLVYLSDERLFPLSLGLNQFRQEQASEWAMLMAASTLMMLPVIGVFFFCQRYFIQGVTLTGLKG